ALPTGCERECSKAYARAAAVSGGPIEVWLQVRERPRGRLGNGDGGLRRLQAHRVVQRIQSSFRAAEAEVVAHRSGTSAIAVIERYGGKLPVLAAQVVRRVHGRDPGGGALVVHRAGGVDAGASSRIVTRADWQAEASVCGKVGVGQPSDVVDGVVDREA